MCGVCGVCLPGNGCVLMNVSFGHGHGLVNDTLRLAETWTLHALDASVGGSTADPWDI